MTEPRCDKHAGDQYPPGCYACESLQLEYADLGPKVTDELGTRAAVAALEASFAARASAEPVSAIPLPAGSWAAIKDCKEFSTRAGIPKAAGDPALVAEDKEMDRGESGPGYLAAAVAGGSSGCLWSGGAHLNDFQVQLVPGAGGWVAHASSLPGWEPVSIAGATDAGVLTDTTYKYQQIVATDGVNLLLSMSSSKLVPSDKYKPVAAAILAALK